MSEPLEHNLGDHEDPLSAPTWMVAFLGAVLLTVVMLGLTALYYNAQGQEDEAKVILRNPEELRDMRMQQRSLLTDPHRRVQELVTVEGQAEEKIVEAIAIPIDQAMELVVKEAGGQK